SALQGSTTDQRDSGELGHRPDRILHGRTGQQARQRRLFDSTAQNNPGSCDVGHICRLLGPLSSRSIHGQLRRRVHFCGHRRLFHLQRAVQRVGRLPPEAYNGDESRFGDIAMTNSRMVDAALALHRFGLGPTGSSLKAISADPRGALLAELDRSNAASVPAANLPNSSQAARALFDFRAERAAKEKMAQRERKAAEAQRMAQGMASDDNAMAARDNP